MVTNLGAIGIRFFGELRDLVTHKSSQIIVYKEIQIGQSVKDLIESCGVPHTEVFLILANQIPVGFDYKLHSGDRISVYPKFYKFEIEQISPISDYHFDEFKFVLDVHLGKLAKNLRMLGFDCIYENNLDDLIIIKIGVDDNRIILTRDLGILKFAKVKWGYLIRSHNSVEQTIEVVQRYNLRDKIIPFCRCMECNELINHIEKNVVFDKLEPKTKLYFEKFSHCPNCNRIYWDGSHTDRMKQIIEEIVLKTKNF